MLSIIYLQILSSSTLASCADQNSRSFSRLLDSCPLLLNSHSYQNNLTKKKIEYLQPLIKILKELFVTLNTKIFFQWLSYFEGQGEPEREREVFHVSHLLVHFLNGPNSQNWDKRKPGTSGPPCWCRGQAVLQCFPSGIESGTVGTLYRMWTTGNSSSHCACWPHTFLNMKYKYSS